VETDINNVLGGARNDQDKMIDAVLKGFEAMAERADFVFFPRLDEIAVGS